MLIDNQSKLPDKDVRRLVNFVSRFFPKNLKEGLAIGVENIHAFSIFHPIGMTGECCFAPPQNRHLDDEVKHLILIRIATLKYPHFLQYTKRSPGMTFRGWEEEFVEVLAHELQHLESYYNKSRQNESKAELRGLEVLTQYRASPPLAYYWPPKT